MKSTTANRDPTQEHLEHHGTQQRPPDLSHDQSDESHWPGGADTQSLRLLLVQVVERPPTVHPETPPPSWRCWKKNKNPTAEDMVLLFGHYRHVAKLWKFHR